MSEPVPTAENVQKEPDSPAPADDKPAKPRRARGQRWRRRVIVFLSVVIIGALAVRALVPLLLPTVLRQVAAQYDLNADYDRFDFYPLAGEVGLWNLRFTPTEGGEPVVSVAYCRGAVDTWALLRGKLFVDRAEAEGALVTVERLADGSIPLLDRFIDETASDEPTDIPLESPVQIRSLRLQDARARLIDRAVAPTTNVEFVLNTMLNHVGAPDRPTDFRVQLNSPEMLGALYLDGHAETGNQKIDADLAIRMIGFNPQPLRSYLAAFGITPVCSDLTGAAAGTLTITPAGGATTRPAGAERAPVTALAARLTLRDIDITADSVPVASVSHVLVDASTLAPGEFRVDKIDVNGVRARAWRDAAGRFGAAGLALGAEPTTRPVQKVETATAGAARVDAGPADRAPATQPAASALPIVELKALNIRDIAFMFDDRAVDSAVAMSIDELSIAGVSTDPADRDKPATISFKASAPGLARAIRATGAIAAARPTKTLELQIAVDDITGAKLDPYLKLVGISRAMQNARFTCTLSGSFKPDEAGGMTLSFQAADLKLVDDQQEWFAFDNLQLDDVYVSPDAQRIRLGKVAISGPAVSLVRAADGTITTLGFNLKPDQLKLPSSGAPQTPTNGAAPSAPAASAPAPSAPAPMKLPVLEIGDLTWNDVALTLDDLTADPPVHVALQDVSVRVQDLTLDPSAGADREGRVSVRAKVPENIESVLIEGVIAPTGDSLALDITGRVDGISLAGLKPLLATVGIEPVMTQGKLAFALNGELKRQGEGVVTDLTLTDVSLIDGQQRWLALKSLALTEASFDLQTLNVARLQIDSPALRLERRPDGALAAAGMKLLPGPEKPAEPNAAPVPSRIELNVPIIARVKALAINDAVLDLDDQAAGATLTPRATLSLNNLALGVDEGPADLQARVALPGVAESLSVDGTVMVAPRRQGAVLTVKGRGIGGKALAPYLPPGIGPASESGVLDAEVALDLQPHEAGGSKASVIASGVRYSDGVTQEPGLEMQSFRLLVDRFDLDAADEKVVAIKELSTEGLALRVIEDARGLVLPMVAIKIDALADAPAAQEQKPQDKPVEQQAEVGPAANVQDLLAAAKVTAPRVKLDKLSIGAELISVKTQGMSGPLTVQNLMLVSATPIDLLGNEPARRAPFRLETRASATASGESLIDQLAMNATLQPFASQPFVHASFNVTGIHADRITRLVPALGNYVDASGLNDGQFAADVELSDLVFTRRGILGIDLQREFGGELLIKNAALRQAGDDTPLAGVEEVRGEKIVVTPGKDGAIQRISVRRLDVVKPAAHIIREKRGIEVLGVLVKLPPDAPTTQEAEQAERIRERAVAVEREIERELPTLDPAGDIRIDWFTVTGINLLVEDRVGTPVTKLPITELDLDVRGLNTRALKEPLPIRFSVLAGAGKVEGEEIFSQFIASGALTVYPKPNGWVKSSLSGFELSAVEGIASQIGIKLTGGTFDFATEVKMEGTDNFNARLFPTFTNLRIEDSSDGIIARTLNLPPIDPKVMSILGINGPLDAAIFAVQGADGTISLPVTAPMKAGELDTGAIVGSALGAVSAQLAQAMVGLPAKAALMMGSVVGIDLFKGAAPDLTPIVLKYAPGESQPTSEQRAQIAELAERLKKDDLLQATLIHSPASEDLVTAGDRVQLSGAEINALAQQLRQRKFSLQRERIEAAGALRVALASQNQQLADTRLARLQDVSERLSETESALDDVLNRLRPGASRMTDRRARQAAIELGQYRLNAVERALQEAQIKDFVDRITVARPMAKVAQEPEIPTGAVIVKLTRKAKQ